MQICLYPRPTSSSLLQCRQHYNANHKLIEQENKVKYPVICRFTRHFLVACGLLNVNCCRSLPSLMFTQMYHQNSLSFMLSPCRWIHYRRYCVLLARRGQRCDWCGQTRIASVLHCGATPCVQRSEVHNRYERITSNYKWFGYGICRFLYMIITFI